MMARVGVEPTTKGLMDKAFSLPTELPRLIVMAQRYQQQSFLPCLHAAHGILETEDDTFDIMLDELTE